MSVTDGNNVRQNADEDARTQLLLESGLLEDFVTEPFDRITRLARRLLGADAAMVSLVGDDRQTFKSHDGLRADIAAEGGTALSHSFCRYAVATGERLIVSDARTSPLLNQSPAISDYDVLAYAGVPIQLRGGQEAVGTLCVVGALPREWSETDVETLEGLAEIAQAEMRGRIASRTAELVERLALRLPEPVARLGDAVRTLTGFADTPTDPRLPRSADLARGRLQAVDALTDDLSRAIAPREAPPTAATIDVGTRLSRALQLVGSSASPGTVQADISTSSLAVNAVTVELDRALSLLLVTFVQHSTPGVPVEVTLQSESGEAVLSVRTRGHAVPVRELLRVVTRFGEQASDAVDVVAAGGVTRVRGSLAQGVTDASGAEVVVRWALAHAPANRPI